MTDGHKLSFSKIQRMFGGFTAELQGWLRDWVLVKQSRQRWALDNWQRW
jgi:hypothetical protein